MALLIGRDDIAAFTGSTFVGFGGGNFSSTLYTAPANASATSLNTNFTEFGPNSFLRVVIYERIGGGSFNQFINIDVPPSAAPQNTVLPVALDLTENAEYLFTFFGDVTSGSGYGGGHQVPTDPTVVSPEGVGGLSYTFESIPDPMGGFARELDGEFFWNLDGVLGIVGNLAVEVTLEQKGIPGALEADKEYQVTVFNTAGAIIIAAQAITSVNGVILIDNQNLGAIGSEVDLKIEDTAETDILARVRLFRVVVFDLDA